MNIWLRRLRKLFWRCRVNIRQILFQNKLLEGGNEIAEDVYITCDSILEGKNRVGCGCTLKWMQVGYGTYFGSNCYFERTMIGKYCSIANRVNVVAGNHPTRKFVSTHPAFFSLYLEDYFGYVHEKLYQEPKFADETRRLAVIIGNDVWIGSNATIMEGVTIGDGAIIAANAVVTKDVKPYEIVAGVPAKHLKWRFEEHERTFLEKFRWWDKPLDWIIENALMFSDIKDFKDKFE